MKRVFSIMLAVVLLLSVLPASAMAASSKKTVYVSSTGEGTLNLRSGPGTGYDPKGYVYHGDRVTVLDRSGEWSKVRTESGRTGWIKTKYIDGTTKSLGTGLKTVHTSSSLNLRSGPGTGYARVGTVCDSWQVKVLNTEGDWVRVTVEATNQTGWIMAKYLGGSSSSGSSGGSSSGSGRSGASLRVYHVTATVNVRTGPGTGYSLKTKLYPGAAFQVTQSSGNWFKIRTFSGVTGWISQTYAASGATGKVTASSLNMRSKASASSALVKTLSRGAKVTVSTVTGNWAKVTSGGKTGYVSINYLSL